jgi:glycosyltransferase 2 family protein
VRLPRPFARATSTIAVKRRMKKIMDRLWPLVGLLAVVGSFYLLYHEFHGASVGAEVWAALKAIPTTNYLAAGASTLLAYAALAWYDRIALLHLGVKHISWVFISVCSFTTYALSHNIGASVFSGAMVRYRAYSSKGLTASQVAVLVVLCSYTFAFGNVLLGGVLLTYRPTLLQRLSGMLPDVVTNPATALTIGLVCLGAVGLYIVGSLMHFKPVTIGKTQIVYPRPDIMLRQLFAAPMELIGAAGIIYFALPETGNPGFLVVLGTFLLSFSAALVSNAPGGLGVFELLFIKAMPDVPPMEVLAALLVFRLFYLIVPLLIAIVVVILFERRKLAEAWRGEIGPDADASK